MATQPTAVKTANIVVEEDHNPREEFSKFPIEQLAASIDSKGILQPLLVTPIGGNKFKLIDGERRLRAAKIAKLKEVPVFVRENVNGDAVALALIANVMREDLNPVEQAQAFKRLQDEKGWNQKQLAAELNVSQSLVSERLALLQLPDDAKGLVAREQVTLDFVRPLANVAKVSPELADHFADVIARNGELRYPGVLDDYEGCAVLLGFGSTLGPKQAEKMFDLDFVNECRSVFGKESWDWPNWGDEDAMAGKEYGCLAEIEVEHLFRRATLQILTDSEFVRGRLEQKIEVANKEKKKAASKAAQAGGEKPLKSDAEQEAARAERDEEISTRRKAFARNVEAGSILARATYAPEISTDLMRVIALAFVNSNDHRHLGRASTAALDEKVTSINERGKVHLMGLGEAQEDLRRRIEFAKTAEEIAGVLMFAIVGSRVVDTEAWPISGRPHYGLPEKEYSDSTVKNLADELALTVFKSGEIHDEIKARLEDAGDDD